MKKAIILLALIALLSTIYSCGGGAGSSSSPSGQNPGVPSVVKLLPSQYIAQTNSYIHLKAKVLDGNGNPVPSITVTFTNLSAVGVISSAKAKTNFLKSSLSWLQSFVGILSSTTANTDSAGIATVKLSSTTPGFATIQAEVDTGAGQVRDKKTVYFSIFDLTLPSPPAPPAPYLTLDVDTDGLFSSPNEDSDRNLFENTDDNQVNIRATVFDSNGTPVSGTVVTFGVDSTEASFPLGSSKTTNAEGQASVLIQVDASILRSSFTILNITASADNGAAGMVSLFLQPVTVSSVSVSANPSVVDPGGGSTITAVVLINTGGPVPDGTSVSFTATCGVVEPFAQTSDGIATATFTAPTTPGTCTITANVGGESDTTDVLVTTNLTVIPTTQTISNPTLLPTPSTAIYTISGGTSPYQAFSSNPGVATVLVAGSTLTATVAAGVSSLTTDTTVTITIYDNVGANVSASLILDVPPTLPLTVIPTTQTKSNPTLGQTAEYKVLGGAGGYSAYSSSPSLVSVPVVVPATNIVTATLGAGVSSLTEDTTVTITIYDSVGDSVSASLILDIVPTVALSVVPSTISLTGIHEPPATTTDDVKFYISGGTGPYSMFSSNTAVIPNVSVVGTTFTIDPDAVATSTTATLTVVDSLGATDTATVTVTPTSTSLGLNPSSIAVYYGTNITFYILGGTPNYTAFTSDGTKATVNGSTTSAPLGSVTTFTVNTLAAGSVTITVQDSTGKTATATVTITAPPAPTPLTAAPPTATICEDNITCSAATDVALFTISGGTGPYTVTSLTPGVIPSPGLLAGSFFTVDATNGSVGADTPVILTVTDTAAGFTSVTVTVIAQ